jgi:hypothetical protein
VISRFTLLLTRYLLINNDKIELTIKRKTKQRQWKEPIIKAKGKHLGSRRDYGFGATSTLSSEYFPFFARACLIKSRRACLGEYAKAYR